LNYRHAFHAGNFADVLKHATFVRVLLHLREKDAAFRVIDTHAGAGRYDLTADEAQRTGEWRDGIGRLLHARVAGQAAPLLEPYLTLIRELNTQTPDTVRTYPGSPLVAALLARPQDRLQLCELHPGERTKLEENFAGDRRARTSDVDGWQALKAFLPPPERRGAVLVDAPFEQPGEFQRLEQGLAEAHRRWASGVYLLWYPIKDTRETEAFARRLARSGIARVLRAELSVGPVNAEAGLSACGVMVVNPPWKLESELSVILPALARSLGRGAAGGYRLDWLAP
jgi:23S rRNA (adenine2030-N6)-methyltransferase